MRKVLIFDTSILCVMLEVPGKSICGPNDDRWDKPRVDKKIQEEEQAKTTFVLPLASIIETGNHIAQASHSRRDCAQRLADLILKSVRQETPWAAFSEHTELWSPVKLEHLAKNLPEMAVRKISLADTTIVHVAEYYAQMPCDVEILTGDRGLKACQPSQISPMPRRRQV